MVGFGGLVMVDSSVRWLRQVQFFVAFGCGAWLIVLAKGDDFNLKSVALAGGICLCQKILLFVADRMRTTSFAACWRTYDAR